MRRRPEGQVDAVIASDLAVIAHARSIGLEVHMSVQANVCNMASVRFYAQYADVVVLARELTLAQIRHIIESIRKEDVRGPSGELLRWKSLPTGRCAWPCPANAT